MARERMPAPLRLAVLGGVGVVLAGALFLIAVRGEALLVDLSSLSQRIFCF
jgi:xanthine/uracil/vitamin C permease (AzgA family)